jgi:hypothetical protein
VEALPSTAADAAAASAGGLVLATAEEQHDTDVPQNSGSQQRVPQQQFAFAAAHGLAAAEKEYLAHQIAALRISLAKRDADVARLEGKDSWLDSG